ncbi:MAG: hypothetical protein WCR40_01745 [Candidatus Paceibacterota bacterium]
MLEKIKTNRKDNTGMEILIKFFIKGESIKEEGVNIMTDKTILTDNNGLYIKTTNIINTYNKTVYSLLLGRSQMISLSSSFDEVFFIIKIFLQSF